MTEHAEDSRLITQTIPTLFRLAIVKITVPLWTKFGTATIDFAFQCIQSGIPTACIGDSGNPEIMRCDGAMKNLLLIPAPLRKQVMEAVHGLKHEIWLWKQDHMELEDEECVFYWRSDGSVDRIKTVQQLVLNVNIDIIKRFNTACMYCLEEDIRSLWAEMLATGRADNFVGRSDSMVPFWVRRLRNGSRLSWTRAATGYFRSCRMYKVVPVLSCSSLFPLLLPEDRMEFLFFLRDPKLDDLRFCLYAMTKEEEEEILKICALKVLYLFYEWPLRDMFLETARKVWSYIDEPSFCELLRHIFYQKPFLTYMHDLDYYKIVEGLWNMSPYSFRDSARRCPNMSRNIDLCLNEMRKKRKAEDEMTKQIVKRVFS